MERVAIHGKWDVPTLDEQVERAEKYGVDTLYRCKDPWALRRFYVNQATGEVAPARCSRWECLYCGPRKVDLWRQLVKAAEPVLFLTLTKAGKTVEEAARAFQTFIQALRRGSKGRGKSLMGTREAYPVEYFAVLERHSDFENNGFHWHVLIKGVEYIPYKEVIQPLWMSATHYNEETGEGAKIAHIERIRNVRAIGYVTKYLTKALSVDERGVKQVKREVTYAVEQEHGGIELEREVVTDEVTSRARRIRYSRQFFPERVAVLREKLFAGLENEVMDTSGELVDEAGDEVLSNEENEAKIRGSWQLVERVIEGKIDIEEYKQERYAELIEEVLDVREEDLEAYQRLKRGIVATVECEARMILRQVYHGLEREVLREVLAANKPLSRRVISIWDYQRHELRWAS
jgi:hypothetical protein